MTSGYYPPRGLNLSKNPCVSCITIDLATTHTLNHCLNPRQLMPTVGQDVKIQSVDCDGINQKKNQGSTARRVGALSTNQLGVHVRKYNV
jgi:hypothetical protein